MTDLDSPKGETSQSVLRFSTFGLLVVLSVASMVFAAYVGIARAVGIEVTEMLANSVRSLRYDTPQIIICFAGILAALSSRLPQSAARLTLLASCGLLLTILASNIGELILGHLMDSSVIGISHLSWWLTAIGILYALLHALCWMLLLLAVFSGRTSAPITPTTDSTP